MTVSTSGPITRHHVGARLSETAVHHGTVYLAGQIPENHPDGDMRVQTQEVLGHVERLLNEAAAARPTSCRATSSSATRPTSR
jgi:enamine deaminase RidA (YjgF/YER057c/UK114 family)